MSSAPGWYPDPDGMGGQRYFDGTNWGPQAPAATAPPPQPPPSQKKPLGCFKTVLGVIGVLFVIGFISSQCDSKNSSSSSSSSSSRPSAMATSSSYAAAPTAPISTPDYTPAPNPAPNFTPGQDNAISKAKSYLSISGFSRKGLIEQLEYDDFSAEDATFAVQQIENDGDVDWNEQAAKKAKRYMSISSFSLSGLTDQLTYDGFTQSQAQYGANAAYNG